MYTHMYVHRYLYTIQIHMYVDVPGTGYYVEWNEWFAVVLLCVCLHIHTHTCT